MDRTVKLREDECRQMGMDGITNRGRDLTSKRGGKARRGDETEAQYSEAGLKMK